MSLQTLNEIFFAVVERDDRVVVMHRRAIQWVSISSSELYQSAAGVARALREWGISRGDRVAILSENRPEWTIADFACLLIGAVVVPVYATLTGEQTAYILRDSGARAIFVSSEKQLVKVQSIQDQTAVERIVVMDGVENANAVRMERLMHGGPKERDAQFDSEARAIGPDDLATIIYTSGTTGRPKGVLHSHNSMHALICQLRDHWQVLPGDRFLVPSPIAHIGGSIYAFESPLLLGASAVLMDRWNADDAVEIIRANRCTHIAGATPFLEQLLTAAEGAGTRLPELKLFICGGASVSPSLIRKAASYFDHAAVTRVYGSTEVPVTTVGAPLDPDHAADTDGRAGFAQITLGGAVGEIHARGPQMLVGYLHPEDEAGSFDDDGYFRTGDLARWVDDDYLVVTGRAKDVIIRSGENIAPKEIEDILIGHPGVAEIAIVGLPDTRTGERACAVIVPSGQSPPDVASLRSFLQDQGVATFKAPEQVVIWEQLPRNDAGKVLKHQIQAALTTTDG